MRTDELDFDLPVELIAQEPSARREACRLLHYRRDGGVIGGGGVGHHVFSELPALLRRGDLLVFNNTRVLPARWMLRKEAGGAIEGLFLRQEKPGRWVVMLKGLENYRGVLRFEGEETLTAICTRVLGGGEYEIEVSTEEAAAVVLGRVGRMPLPPYIKREKGRDRRDEVDRERYQTVYARGAEAEKAAEASVAGSVAAPTAGLHFTPELLEELEGRGIEQAFVTLAVGLGTFKPVTAGTLGEHVMHCESYEISEGAAEALNRAGAEGRRIVAVGTTSARVLESHPAGERWKATCADTSILIYPPYRWKHVGALVTNFHLPRSTLVALVAAFVGLEEQRRIYAEAIERRYQFFSYGDAMLVE